MVKQNVTVLGGGGGGGVHGILGAGIRRFYKNGERMVARNSGGHDIRGGGGGGGIGRFYRT